MKKSLLVILIIVIILLGTILFLNNYFKENNQDKVIIKSDNLINENYLYIEITEEAEEIKKILSNLEFSTEISYDNLGYDYYIIIDQNHSYGLLINGNYIRIKNTGAILTNEELNRILEIIQKYEKASKNTATTNEVATNTHSVSYDCENYKNLPINYTHVVYEHDTSTPEKAIGVADYAFIAKVNSIIRTEYKYPVEAVVNGEIKTVTIPYTVYSVTVIENIKGELIKTKEIEVMQYGGLEEDTKSYSFHEGMNLLNVGEYYILLVYASSEDGTLLIDSKDSVVSLENMDIVAKYKQAAQNPIVPNNVEVTKSKRYDAKLSK